MDIHKVFDKIHDQIENHKNDEHVEIEMRLGKFNGKMFDTNVGKDNFDKVMTGLQKYNQWDQVVLSDQEVFYRERDNTRITVDDNTGDETIIKKERVKNEDFKRLKNSPYDLRISISKELPIQDLQDREMDKKKTKTRVSFIRKNLSIDMTKCTGDMHDMDAEDPVTYQIELEIVDPTRVQTKDELFNILHKVKDVISILGNAK